MPDAMSIRQQSVAFNDSSEDRDRFVSILIFRMDLPPHGVIGGTHRSGSFRKLHQVPDHTVHTKLQSCGVHHTRAARAICFDSKTTPAQVPAQSRWQRCLDRPSFFFAVQFRRLVVHPAEACAGGFQGITAVSNEIGA